MVTSITSDYLLSIDELNNHFKVFAGPGAGKTHFLVSNIKNIIGATNIISNFKHKKVACITYTNSAVDEIKSRLNDFEDYVDISTIHNFVYSNIISVFYMDIYKIILEDFGFNIKKRLKPKPQVEGLSLLFDVNREDIYEFIKSKCDIDKDFSFSKKSMGDIQIDFDKYLENEKIELKHSKKMNICEAMAIKEYILSHVAVLSHDEILYYGYKILLKNEYARYFVQLKYPHILIDEFQDTSPFQVEILKLLGNKNCRIGIIGDFAQSIYSFQGAKPHYFISLMSIGNEDLKVFSIEGNRRSTKHIVSFCNYIRSEDNLVQYSINKDKEDTINNALIKIIIGDSEKTSEVIDKIVEKDGVVITRTWSQAIDYMHNVKTEQKALFTRIYNSYFHSPIDIRKEIEEINNVQWVRAFRFIIDLNEAYENKSINMLIRAFKVYYAFKKVDELLEMTAKAFNLLFINLAKLFSEKDIAMINLIETYNKLFSETKQIFNSDTKFNHEIEWLSEYDDNIVKYLSEISFDTAKKIFNDVFTKSGKYITVHQAKGLQWDSVVVSLKPSKFDGTKLEDTLLKPTIVAETPKDEFTRMFYVACSRAKSNLYIHVSENEAQVIKFLQKEKRLPLEIIG